MVALCVVAVVLIAVGIVLVKFDDGNLEWIGVSGIISIGLGGFMAIVMCLAIPMAIKDKAFIERSFGKSYTVEEMFWNGEDIKEMVIGNKMRFEEVK